VIADAWMKFPEIAAIAVIGSVARPLWKEVARSGNFAAPASRSGTNAAISTSPLRIGINSGTALVADDGSAERLSYTAIGDTTNLRAAWSGSPGALRRGGLE
jgi:adenylate cyclase